MSSSDVSDLASVQLARRLQEEEDQLAAYQLQHHLNSGPSPPFRLDRVQTLSYNIPPNVGNVRTYVVSDEEEGDDDDDDDTDSDVRELNYVSDDDTMDVEPPLMSPETHEIVTSALDTAFSTPRHDIVVLDDGEVEDFRTPPRQTRSRTARIQSNQQPPPPPSRPPPSSRQRPNVDDSDNVILTVGRNTHHPQALPRSSIVITNNSAAPPSANTRSRTRSNQNSEPNTDNTLVDLGASSSSSSNSRQRTRGSNNRGGNHRTRRNSQGNNHSRSRSTSSIQIITSEPSSQGGPRSTARSSEARPSTSSGRRPPNLPRGARVPNPQPQGLINVNRGIIINGIPLRQLGLDYRINQHSYGTVQNLAALLRDSAAGMGLNDSMSYEEMIALDESSELQPGQGLSSLEISQNTLTKPFSASSNSAGNNSTSCNICLSDFTDGEKIRVLPCFHSFHSECIDNWLYRKPECPVCRSRVTPEDD